AGNASRRRLEPHPRADPAVVLPRVRICIAVTIHRCSELGLLPPPTKPRPAGVWSLLKFAGSGQARSRLGEGWGGGGCGNAPALPHTTTPTPNPSPQGGGERTECVGRCASNAKRTRSHTLLLLRFYRSFPRKRESSPLLWVPAFAGTSGESALFNWGRLV